MKKYLLIAVLFICSGCAINKENGSYNVSVDMGEMTGTSIVQFNVGDEPATLRRNDSKNYEIKLSRRMKIIDLGLIAPPSIVATYRIDSTDLIVVNTPSLACMYQYRIYVLDGYQTSMYTINDRAEDCNNRIDFKIIDKSLSMVQITKKPTFLRWLWSENQLTEFRYSRALPGYEEKKSSVPKSVSDRFEHNSSSPSKPSVPKADAVNKKQKKQDIQKITPAKINSTPAQLNTPSKIDHGNYDSIQTSSKPITAVKLTLRDGK